MRISSGYCDTHILPGIFNPGALEAGATMRTCILIRFPRGSQNSRNAVYKSRFPTVPIQSIFAGFKSGWVLCSRRKLPASGRRSTEFGSRIRSYIYSPCRASSSIREYSISDAATARFRWLSIRARRISAASGRSLTRSPAMRSLSRWQASGLPTCGRGS